MWLSFPEKSSHMHTKISKDEGFCSQLAAVLHRHISKEAVPWLTSMCHSYGDCSPPQINQGRRTWTRFPGLDAQSYVVHKQAQEREWNRHAKCKLLMSLFLHQIFQILHISFHFIYFLFLCVSWPKPVFSLKIPVLSAVMISCDYLQVFAGFESHHPHLLPLLPFCCGSRSGRAAAAASEVFV